MLTSEKHSQPHQEILMKQQQLNNFFPVIIQKWKLKYSAGGSQVQKCLLYFCVRFWMKHLVCQ